MSDQADKEPAEVFQSTIKRFCKAHAWEIYEINEKKVKLKFQAESGNTHSLFVYRYDKDMLLEFSVPSGLSFPSGDQMPHGLSTILLERNSKLKLGFWCVEQLEDERTYTVIHNEEIGLLNSDYFGRIARRLVEQCDDFLETLKLMEEEE